MNFLIHKVKELCAKRNFFHVFYPGVIHNLAYYIQDKKRPVSDRILPRLTTF